uniref:non-specific serine/threonine protein kinase n=2 Tax=Lotharella globosa TaxID=91324 RepID=A0A7S4DGV3_9EUKA
MGQELQNSYRAFSAPHITDSSLQREPSDEDRLPPLTRTPSASSKVSSRRFSDLSPWRRRSSGAVLDKAMHRIIVSDRKKNDMRSPQPQLKRGQSCTSKGNLQRSKTDADGLQLTSLAGIPNCISSDTNILKAVRSLSPSSNVNLNGFNQKLVSKMNSINSLSSPSPKGAENFFTAKPRRPKHLPGLRTSLPPSGFGTPSMDAADGNESYVSQTAQGANGYEGLLADLSIHASGPGAVPKSTLSGDSDAALARKFKFSSDNPTWGGAGVLDGESAGGTVSSLDTPDIARNDKVVLSRQNTMETAQMMPRASSSTQNSTVPDVLQGSFSRQNSVATDRVVHPPLPPSQQGKELNLQCEISRQGTGAFDGVGLPEGFPSMVRGVTKDAQSAGSGSAGVSRSTTNTSRQETIATDHSAGSGGTCVGNGEKGAAMIETGVISSASPTSKRKGRKTRRTRSPQAGHEVKRGFDETQFRSSNNRVAPSKDLSSHNREREIHREDTGTFGDMSGMPESVPAMVRGVTKDVQSATSSDGVGRTIARRDLCDNNSVTSDTSSRGDGIIAAAVAAAKSKLVTSINQVEPKTKYCRETHPTKSKNTAIPLSSLLPPSMHRPHGGELKIPASEELSYFHDEKEVKVSDSTGFREEEKLRESSLDLVRVIGSGGYARVWLANFRGREVAVKRMDAPNTSPPARKRCTDGKKSPSEVLEMEVGLLRRFRHENIVQYIGVYITSGWSHGTIYNIVMEYVPDGDLDAFIRKNGALSEHTSASLTDQIASGLAYLHSNKVIHRDLKPGNLLLRRWQNDRGNAQLTVKISDFGVSANVKGEEVAKRSCVGTPWYLAPEVARVQPYSYAADIWSLGSVMYTMVTGNKPYHKLAPIPALFKIAREGPPKVEPGDSLGLSKSFVTLLKACWQSDPSDRPSAKEVGAHPWILSGGRTLETH